MIRLIKRYGSRKLYDTEESRYVSLEELAALVRSGQEIRVVDNDTEEDVTTQTLAQVILEEGRSGRRLFPSDVLRDMIRFGGETLSTGVEQMQRGMEKAIESSLARLAPVVEARDEVARLRTRLEELERALGEIERQGPVRESTRKKTASKKTASEKTASEKTRARDPQRSTKKSPTAKKAAPARKAAAARKRTTTKNGGDAAGARKVVRRRTGSREPAKTENEHG